MRCLYEKQHYICLELENQNMKKIYALLSIFTLTTAVSVAQVDIKEFIPNSQTVTGNNLNGTAIEQVVGGDDEVLIHIGVVNNIGSDKILKIQRNKITDTPNWNMYNGYLNEEICWGSVPASVNDVCQNPDTNPWTSPEPLVVADNGIGYLKFKIHTNGPGSIHYRFYVMDGSTKVDSVDIKLATALSIKDKKSEEASLSVYPNPANSFLTISTQGIDGNYEVKMTDVLGKVVYNESATGASKKVDVSDFKNGVYVITVTEKGTAIQTRRVVVKH